MSESPSERQLLNDLLGDLRARVEERRAEGLYPPELEATLDAHFARLLGSRLASTPDVYGQLARSLDELREFEYGNGATNPSSRIPGGRFVHRAISKAVSREIAGVLVQSQAYAQLVSQCVSLIAEVVLVLGREYDTRVLEQLDQLMLRVAEQQRALNALQRRVEATQSESSE